MNLNRDYIWSFTERTVWVSSASIAKGWFGKVVSCRNLIYGKRMKSLMFSYGI